MNTTRPPHGGARHGAGRPALGAPHRMGFGDLWPAVAAEAERRGVPPSNLVRALVADGLAQRELITSEAAAPWLVRAGVTALGVQPHRKAEIDAAAAAGTYASQSQDDDVPDEVEEPEPEERRRPEPQLGEGWTTTSHGVDDPDCTLWWHDTQVGHVHRRGKGWMATRASGVSETNGTGPSGTYPSRIRALLALAAEDERKRRAVTPHAEVPLDGLPGWRLTQTRLERSIGVWRVVDPSGQTAGQVTKDWWKTLTEWRATSGDPDNHAYAPETIIPPADHPARGHPPLWRTRTAAAHAVAHRKAVISAAGAAAKCASQGPDDDVSDEARNQ